MSNGNDLSGADEQPPAVSYSIDDPQWLEQVETSPAMVRYAVKNGDGLDADKWGSFRSSVLRAVQQYALDVVATDTDNAETGAAGLQVQYVVPDGSDDLINVLRYFARKAGLKSPGALATWGLTDYKQL